MNIGLVAHVEKTGARELTQNLAREFDAAGFSVILETATATLIGDSSTHSIRELEERCDLIVVLGGDGTLLRAAHGLRQFTKPLLGINLGSLGFLTCVSSHDYKRAVRHLVDGDYILSPRALLHTEVMRGGKHVATSTCLNDAVISRGAHSHLIKLDLIIDEKHLTRYNADGLIIATPTGSTAYSLSAGGPVLMPQAGVFVVTPICPHVLTNRSLIVSGDSVMEIRPAVSSERELFLNVDGHQIIAIAPDDRIRLRKADMELPLVMLPGMDFPVLLRQKLKWSGSNI